MDYHFEKGKFREAELESAIITLFEAQNYYISMAKSILHITCDIDVWNDILKHRTDKKVLSTEKV